MPHVPAGRAGKAFLDRGTTTIHSMVDDKDAQLISVYNTNRVIFMMIRPVYHRAGKRGIECGDKVIKTFGEVGVRLPRRRRIDSVGVVRLGSLLAGKSSLTDMYVFVCDQRTKRRRVPSTFHWSDILVHICRSALSLRVPVLGFNIQLPRRHLEKVPR